jgi:PEP-CTERM motif
MKINKFRPWVNCAAAGWLVAGLTVNSALADITPYAPDAWDRGNDADTSYFGWDAMEVAGAPNFGFLYMLDDSTPDLGSGITATGTRIFQGTDGFGDPAPTTDGHVSSTTNYYSFFDNADDTITATAPASGSGGFTTVVIQYYENVGGDGNADLLFAMDNSVNTWTLDKHLFNFQANGRSIHWLEWTAPGDNLTFSATMTSLGPHRVIDSFQVDTYWSADAAVVNAITAVPEPASWLLALGSLAACLARRRMFGR